jgi:hypothetical protein
MTTPADVRTDEEAFAACLAGRPVPAGAQHLVAFTDAVRAGATAPGRPNAALAGLLATGLLTDTSEPSTRTAGHPARASRKRPRMLLSTLTAKLAAAGIAAKAAAATGVVAVALTGAATAGALPGQDDTTAVIESGDGSVAEPTDGAADPTDGAADPTDGAADPTDGAADPTDGAADPTDGADGSGGEVSDLPAPEVSEEPVTKPELTEDQWATAGPAEGQSHGDWVSEGARNGWVDGRTVSEQAHERNAGRQAARNGGGAAQPAEESETEAPAVQEAAPAPAPAPAPAATGGGNGNAGGNGNGKK